MAQQEELERPDEVQEEHDASTSGTDIPSLPSTVAEGLFGVPDVRRPAQDDSSAVKLFLGGLSWSLTEDQLKEYFETKFGVDVEEVVIMRDKYTSRPRGFGFLTLRDEDAAARICEETHVLDGRQIDAKRSMPQNQKPKMRKLFVGGLAPETTEEGFREYFGQFGAVTEAQIMQDHTSGRSRGFGFITYDEEAAVDRVFAKGRMHELAGKSVEVKRATPKGSGPAAFGRGIPMQRLDPPTGGRGMDVVGFNYQGWPGYGRANGIISGYGSSPPPGYQVQYGPYGHSPPYSNGNHMQQMSGYGHAGYAYMGHPGGHSV